LAVAVVAVKAHVKHAVKAQHVHRATAPRHRAEMDHRAHKAPRALKARATAAAKVATVTVAVVVKSNGAIPVLTTVAMAKAVPHLAVLVLKVVAQVAAHRAAMANTPAVKTADATMATSCPATSTP
jgi:hypothetical protein